MSGIEQTVRRHVAGRWCHGLGVGLGVGLLVGLLVLGCGETAAPDGEGGPDAGAAGFWDHTMSAFESQEAFLSFAGDETPAQLKVILGSFEASAGPAWFLEPGFYTLHDEWLWFNLLNGQAVPGVELAPVEGSFDSIEAIYEHFAGAEVLPLDLKWVESRLYSPLFYRLALGRAWDPVAKTYQPAPRELALGSVLHYPADAARAVPEELWLFELEYVDRPDEAMLLKVRERLAQVLPADVAGRLKWLARPSLQQEQLAETLRAGSGALKDRVVTYADLVVPGEVQVYNPGIVAGRIRTFEAGALGGASVGPGDIVVTGDVPDYLPPVAAIISAVPQTPLAHLNLLARSRGTPNAYVGGVLGDPELGDWAWYHTPVIVEVARGPGGEGPGAVRWAAMTGAEYKEYQKRLGKRELSVPTVDLAAAPYLVDLTQGGLGDMEALVPLVGGKAAGFLALQTVSGGEVPRSPLAVSIRAYHEHLAPLVGWIKAVMADAAFRDDPRVRFVALEGPDGFQKDHAGDPEALSWLSGFLAALPDGGPLTAMVHGGGLKAQVRALPLEPAFLTALTAALQARYADLAKTQGLRFRSSSTAEDVEGFNGAGLYDSNTGFLFPEAQATPKEQKRSVAWAIKKTWASYWSFEAFEERQSAGFDHLAANMAVLIHPRHDDPLELANGVLTFTLARRAGTDLREMVLNVQDGALSVTNPIPGDPSAPEIDRVTRDAAGALQVERVQGSTEVAVGATVLSEAELGGLFEMAERTADAWLDQNNSQRHPAEQHSTLILDFEFKRMAAAWPQMADGSVAPKDRLTLKQVRPLDRPVILTQADLMGERVPGDLLSMTVRVTERTCQSAEVRFRSLELYTDPAAAHLMDYVTRPFAAYVSVAFSADVPVSGLKKDVAMKIGHAQLASVDHTPPAGSAWAVSFALPSGAAKAWGFESFAMDDSGAWSVSAADAGYTGQGVTCTTVDRVVGPTEYLKGLLAQKLAD